MATLSSDMVHDGAAPAPHAPRRSLTGRERGHFRKEKCVSCFFLTWLLCTAILSGVAWADAPATEPPHRLGAENPPYPPDGVGCLVVTLDVVVDAKGGVAGCRAIDGKDPFARAAVDAVATWRFAPAFREGHPVTARIRVRVRFDEPRASAARASASPPVAEVVVRGVRPDPSHPQLTGKEVRQLPGAFGDAFRAIEALPGVTPILSGLPYFLVRGAPPGDTGFFIDGVRVPALFHLGVGAAVVHPGLIERVDLYPGVYPARFGRFTGGILSGEILETPERTHAEASLRVVDAGGLVAAPLDGGRADIVLSGRYGYPGPLLSLFSPDLSLAYWDYQARVRYRPTDRDELSAFFFGSFDSLSESPPSSTTIGIEFHRAQLRWEHRTTDAGVIRTALTLGYDRSDERFSGPSGSATDAQNGTFALSTEWSKGLWENADVRAGADIVTEPYALSHPSFALPGIQSSIASLLPALPSQTAYGWQTDVTFGTFAEIHAVLSPRVDVRAGARVDAFASHYPASPSAKTLVVAAVDPRLTVRFQVARAVSLATAAGIAHQASNFPLPWPGLALSQLSRGLQTSYQFSQGVEVELPFKFLAASNAFVHDYTGLVDYYDTCGATVGACSSQTVAGRAVGIEVLVKRALTERFTGWVSYTLSRSERDASFDGQWTRRLSEFDRTHVANVVFSADLGRGWRAGARWVAYSGLPYATSNPTAPPDARAPPFFRLDLRAEKRFRALGAKMGVVFEWLNALLQKESTGTTCVATGYGVVSCRPTELAVPITLPSVGVEGAWPE